MNPPTSGLCCQTVNLFLIWIVSASSESVLILGWALKPRIHLIGIRQAIYESSLSALCLQTVNPP
jgi:hypothetical protein